MDCYHGNVISLIQFDESMIVYDACRLIRERVPDAAQGQRKSPPYTRTAVSAHRDNVTYVHIIYIIYKTTAGL